MKRAARRDLRELARKERARLAGVANESGSVSKEDFESLDRMEKLAAGDRSWHQWWIPGCAFLIPLAVVTFLVKTEQGKTEIDLDASVSAFSATWRDKQALFDRALLKAFNATGLENVDRLAAGDGDCSVDVKLGSKPGPEEAINLQLLEAPKGWRVRVERSEKSIDVTLSDPAAKPGAAHEEVPVTVSLGGQATVETRCGGVRTLREFKASDIGKVDLRLGQQSTLSLTAAEGHPLRFARQIAVEKVALGEEDITFGDVAKNRPISSVLSGTLYWDALDGKQMTLRPSEALSFSESTGRLRSVTAEANGLHLELFAAVKDMKTGEAPNERSLMPSYLQWIAARAELWLWWGSAVSVFAVVMSVLRWLKITA
jgi:hypothetical protein